LDRSAVAAAGVGLYRDACVNTLRVRANLWDGTAQRVQGRRTEAVPATAAARESTISPGFSTS
jgi:hypothetical protein